MILKKLAIVSTHPIQYNAPLFKLLTERNVIQIKVFYTWGESVLKDKYDPGFNKVIEWDIPLLNGYSYQFVNNISKRPGSDYFNGIINPSLNSEIEKWGADAVLVYGWSFKSHLGCLRYFHKKIPVFFRGDSTLLDDAGKGLKSLLKGWLLKWIYRHVDKALHVGKHNKAYFLKYGLKESQLVFAPHAIENERFSFPPKKDFRKELGIKGNDVVFLFAGKFESKKNPELLIDAFCQILNQNVYLVLVGNGHLEAKIKSNISGLEESVRSRIKLMDFQNQSAMPDVYKMADVVVLPSRGPGETWGLAVNEAMASRKAVLVSDKCGCAPDLVIEGITGYVFQSDNVTDLVSKIMLLADKEKACAMGMKSKENIKHWSIGSIANVIENVVLHNSESI
ncbi:MAG: glycosyltransferase family 4 protein [Ferruginibacter sp.]|nr:glycosyltransferase family 4 protein [Ferruginibacter sp.]